MHEDQHQYSTGRFDWGRLPERTPDTELWPRVLAARQRRLRARHVRRGGFAFAAAAVVVVVMLLLRPPPALPLQQEIVAGQRESQVLESQWRHLSSARHADAICATRLRGIDAALQAAYDHGGANDELVPLWQQRNQALRGLIAQFQDTNGAESAVTRI